MNYNTDYDGRITEPGMYHGEPAWVPRAHEQSMSEDWQSWRVGDAVITYAPVTHQDLEWGFDLELGTYKALVLAQGSIQGFILPAPPTQNSGDQGGCI